MISLTELKERGSTHIYKVKKISKEEIEEISQLCTYDQPAFCNAACPLKLDVKAMLAAAAAGDLKKALQIYEKATPFPRLLSQGCEAPCERKCRISEIGEGVAIHEIEKALAFCAERTPSSSVFRMKKKKTVAVFGSDMFCLFLCGELEKKMYPLTVYTETESIEEYARLCGAENELERIKSLDIRFVFGAVMTRDYFERERTEYNVCCLSSKITSTLFAGKRLNEAFMLLEDENLIAGAGEGVLEIAFNAKKAALTVDRLAQNLSADNMRGQEGACESRLYTDLTEAKKLKRTEKTSDIYTAEEAAAEAGRCISCECRECFKGCEFLRKFEKPPSLLAREIYNNTQIIMGDHPLNRIMNACALCGQCKVMCPNGFDMVKVCRTARENMVATDKMSLAVHEFALQDMLFSNEEAFLSRPQPRYEKCRYVFFPGCQASAIAPEAVRAAYGDLCARLEGGVALMLGCCGAICGWAGRYELYDNTKEFINNELKKLGDPIIITACPTCSKEFSGHKTEGIWDVLNRIGLPAGTSETGIEAAVHDSCGARGDADTQASVRKLAESLGFTVIETEYSGDRSPCCGYGGLTVYTDRDLARRMTDKCLERTELPYITYCVACRDRFAAEGRSSKHILELVYGKEAGLSPDISEKRYNRLMLRQTILREVFNEEIEEMDLGFTVEYTHEAETIMNDRMILKSDVTGVFRALRENGNAVRDIESGRLITSHRQGNVTFWVVYEETQTGYLVFSAYSHRMTVDIREI